MDSVNILLIEDNEGDILLISKAFKNMKLANDLHVCENGEEALEYLEQAPQDEMPDLILLDINMPVMDGKTFLKKIKNEIPFSHIPVIMLTSSENDREVVDFYRLGASSYLVKPVEFENFLEIVKAIENFWVKLVKFKSKA
jgi:CheY-like chemotaxis protein